MTTTAMFRRASLEDLPALVALLADDPLGATRENTAQPLDPGYTAAFRAMEGDANYCLAVAEKGGVVVGCLQLSFLPGLSHRGMWRGQIENVRISRAMRGQGLGSEMIRWAIEACRERKCGLVQLTSHSSRSNARRLYEALGFEATHVGLKLFL
jgi:ribosomal protein S18 acetylase RimI-like enzyme